MATPKTPRKVAGDIVTPSANFTRPADTTAYASGDLVANSTTAGSVVALSWVVGSPDSRKGFIRKVRMWSSDSDTTNASFRIHFYTANPCSTAPTNGDNGAYAMAVSDGNSIYIGAVDITFDRTINNSDAYGSGVPGTGAEMNYDLGTGTTLYALIEARAAYTPASGEVFTVVPEIHLY